MAPRRLRRPSARATVATVAFAVLAAGSAGAAFAAKPTSANGKHRSADTTAPSVSISSPASGATVAGTVSVNGTGSDNTSLAGVAVQVDGGSWQTATGTSSWSWSWSTTSVANGTHTVTARATDSAGNASTDSVSVSISNSTGSTGSTGSAPNTQGSWTSPEGVKINVSSSGPWTINQIYSILAANAYELNLIGPHLTINVQDTTASQTATSGSGSSYQAVMYLKGVSSTFASHPDSQETHEYGHAWTQYHLATQNGGSWSGYLNERWSSSDGSVTLATDSRTGTSYTWNPSEIIADDYRLLFGTTAAQSLSHLNGYVVDPRQQPGLKSWLVDHFATGA